MKNNSLAYFRYKNKKYFFVCELCVLCVFVCVFVGESVYIYGYHIAVSVKTLARVCKCV